MEGQITSLLDNIASIEQNRAFERSIVQLDTVKKPVSSRGVSLRGETQGLLYETVRITAYVKRSPRKDLNPVILFPEYREDEG
jgi:hypothetical protein